MLRITLAQLNYTVGDIEGNVQRMRDAARQAHEDRAHIVVFSELSLCGYYPGDLLDEPWFMERVQEGLEQLRSASAEYPELHWVVGAPTRAKTPGRPLHNSLLVLQGGKLRLQYDKQLLPSHNIFAERRHFEPGPDVAKVLRIGHMQVGFMICEDGWNDSGDDYAINPLQRMADASPDLLISINASPSHLGKRELRHEVFSAVASRHGLSLLYVNQVGGHDQIIFDGASFASEPEHGVVLETPRFEECVTTLVFEEGRFGRADGQPLGPVPAEGLPTMEFYRQQIVLGLRDYARRCGFTQAVVGSSGGIDSALTLALAAEALGPENVVGITMPSVFSSAGSVDDSVDLARNLGITLHRHPIGEIVDRYAEEFERSFGQPLQGLPLENVQARIRGTALMEYSNAFGHLLLTTGNKSEVSVGYCTLYGDTNGGLGLLGDLYKTEVFALSRHINATAGRELIPQAVIDKPPSAELAPGQKDEDSLPPYDVLDEILKLLIEGPHLHRDEYARVRQFVDQLLQQPEGRALVEKVQRMIHRSEYKRRQSPPILRVRPRAFGTGRQMPIAARYP
ncbi:NAD+ synthase [Comamonas endophytica]|uniref:Glutamine-dependent NAD(+) synthetase n=1 Tax=Comamonas endophytica TaxID=2949090 RepID=A0ABY6GDH5_9BURK|nr:MULTISPECIES: NAD+ synthase [unclassified Acidovorax]MCD2512914.1 NAD+ synthase [Acidovorax sp. D4N7]UYG52740.1 NAD+ synthase [Acidovorax sp. 5MLIR]